MAQYESNVKHVPYSQERVYDKLSDLNNLAAIRERMDAVSYTHLTLPTSDLV